MNQNIYIWILVLALLSCNGKTEKVTDIASVPGPADIPIRLHKLKKLSIAGDFDGDREMDTIFQHNYSSLTKTEIDSAADPFQNEWETVVKWFYNQNANVYLTIHERNQDTLHLGIAQGLYCLINIGDNNSDGRDEIAFVVDYCDFSRVNSCKIYSLCGDKWTRLNEFGIFEGSFDFTDKEPVFDNIKNHLEKRNGEWVYNDYLDDETMGQMSRLTIGKCR